MLNRTFFSFVRSRTLHRPRHFHALGRRTIGSAVRKVDEHLSKIKGSLDFLLYVTPINVDSAWAQFRRGRYQHVPEFFYRPLAIDPVELKRHLFSVSLDRIEDPVLYELFRDEIVDIDRHVSMLEDRNRRPFLFGSQQIFGSPDEELHSIARQIIETIPRRSRRPAGVSNLSAIEFAAMAEAELNILREIYPTLEARVRIRSDISGVMVSKGDLLIGRAVKISADRAYALIQHEVGTHIVTHFNGAQQPFQLLRSGLKGYEELQEGLAVVAEFLVGGLNRSRMRTLGGRVSAIEQMVQGATFVEVFQNLVEDGFQKRTAFQITVRAFRGGGFTKDIVYLRGLKTITEYVRTGDDLSSLFVGKIGIEHIDLVEELRLREVLIAPTVLPTFLSDPAVQTRIHQLLEASSPLDLVDVPRRHRLAV